MELPPPSFRPLDLNASIRLSQKLKTQSQPIPVETLEALRKVSTALEEMAKREGEAGGKKR